MKRRRRKRLRRCLGTSPAYPKQLGCMGNVQLLGQLYSQAFGAVMLTSKAYLQQAAERMLTRNRSWAGWKMRRHQDIAGLT